MVTYRIGLLDDNASKLTEVVDMLRHAFVETPRYNNYAFEPIEISVNTDCSTTVEAILEENIECMIIDYNLSSIVGYNGVEVANELWRHRKNMPVFMLTSFDEDMYEHEFFNAFQIFNYDRYLSEKKEQYEIHRKIVRTIEIHKKIIAGWEKELLSLLEHRGENALIDSRILEIDSEIEAALDGVSSLPMKTKHDLSESGLMKLVEQLDLIIKENK